jgi:hypothetical protein
LGAKHAPQLRRRGGHGLVSLALGDLHVSEDAREAAHEAGAFGIAVVSRGPEAAAGAGIRVAVEALVDTEVVCERT